MLMTRRTLLQIASMAPLAAATGKSPSVVVFSKHMAQYGYRDLAINAKKLGFDGVDLTVRPKGHVLPENAAQDLPKAVEAIRAEGLSVPMITTDLTSAADAAARPTLSTASKLRIPFFKMGYLRYGKGGIDVQAKLASSKDNIAGLARMAAEYQVAMGVHNHSGDYFGAAVWDTREAIASLDPKWTGYYFDPAHATIEGGLGGWKFSLDLAVRNLKMVALKDFYWEKVEGKWRVAWCPMGEGMVNWRPVFASFAKAGFAGPFTLHSEYKGGEEPAAMERDLKFVRELIKQTF
jgi:L-ribulose-5-phosphate 3-epimerase